MEFQSNAEKSQFEKHFEYAIKQFKVNGKELRGVLQAELPVGEEGLTITQDVFKEQNERF